MTTRPLGTHELWAEQTDAAENYSTARCRKIADAWCVPHFAKLLLGKQ